MKRFIIMIFVIVLVLSVFVTGAFAAKPDKPQIESAQSEDESDDGGDNEADDQTGAGLMRPNEKRDEKKLFREETRVLIDQIHANQAKWGAMGEQQGEIGDLIEAAIESIINDGGMLDEAALALVQEKIAVIKALKEEMKGLKDFIRDLWKEYIKAKKAANISYGTAALNAIIAKQELRIGIRQQIVTVMNELCPILGIEAPVYDTGDEGEEEETED